MKKLKNRTPQERRTQILRIKVTDPRDEAQQAARTGHGYGVALSNLALAEASLIGARGQDSAQPHFLALVKEIERVYGIEFEDVNEAS